MKDFKFKPMGRVIYNYNDYAKDLKNSIDYSVCYCQEEKLNELINPTYGHILTDSLDIVYNKTLSEIMTYGRDTELREY